MNDAFNGVIQRKLALLDMQVIELAKRLESVDKERFVQDWAMRAMTERALQVAAEIMIDVAERVIAIQGAGPVSSAAEAIERLARLGVLGSAEPYVRIVRFRNLIVHRYEQLDPAIVFDLAKNHLGEFRRFRDELDRLAAREEPGRPDAPNPRP